MPQLLLLAGSALIAGSTATLTAAAVGSALLADAIVIGLSFASSAFAADPEQQVRGIDVELAADSAYPRQLVLGRQAVGGSLVYRQTRGNNNAQLDLVIALADHEIEGVHEVWVDDQLVTINGDNSVTEFTKGGVPYMSIAFRYGTMGQSAFSVVRDNSGGNWTDDHRGAGVALAYVRLTYDEELFPQGVPSFLWVLDGAKLYDRRLDDTNGGTGAHRWGTPSTYEWTDNATVAAENYYRGIYTSDGQHLVFGMGAANSQLDAATWPAAHNVCDENVTLADGITTEKRYRIGATISSNDQHGDNIKSLLSACGGEVVDQGGVIAMHAGAARLSVEGITDDDLLVDYPVTISPARSRADIVNAVFALYTDPETRYSRTEIPKRSDPADVAEDGGVHLPRTLELDFVTSATQAQRIAEIELRKARIEDVVQIPLRRRLAKLEPGDWITWNSDRYGYTDQTFQIIQAEYLPDLSLLVTMQRVNASAWGWNYQVDEDVTFTTGDLDTGGSTLVQVPGFSVAVTEVTNANGETVPGLVFTWTPFDNPTVDDPTVTEVIFEWRQVSDGTEATTYTTSTVAVNRGQLKVTEGVTSETYYEARAIPVAEPARTMTWTDWLGAGVATTRRVTLVTETDLYGDITERLDQIKTESTASLSTKIDSLRSDMDSVSEAIASGTIYTADQSQKVLYAAEALHDRSEARITEVDTYYATETGALAQRVVLLEATAFGDLGDLEASIYTQLATLSSETEALASYDVLLDARLTTTEGDVVANASAIDSANASITTLDGEITTQANRITGVEADLTGKAEASVVQSMQVTLTEVDGKVTEWEAYYALSVDAGTATASFVLLADGLSGISAIELNADQIRLNGTVIINGTIWAEDKLADYSITSSKFAPGALDEAVFGEDISNRLDQLQYDNEQALGKQIERMRGEVDRIAEMVASGSIYTAAQSWEVKYQAEALHDRSEARITDFEEVTADDFEAVAARATLIEASVDANEALIFEEQTARSDGDTANASSITALDARVTTAEGDIATNSASIVTEQTARASGDSANASSITLLDTRLTTAEGNVTANATALSSLETEVSTIDGTVTSHATRLDGLDTTVAGKASITSVNSLEQTVTSNSSSISTNASAISGLQTEVNGKATITSVDSLAQRVTVTESDISSVASRTTTLENEVANKATITAVDSLASEVSANDTDIAAHGTRLTSIEGELPNKASASVVTAQGVRLTSVEGEVTELQAYYGLKVDAATAVASIVLLADGVQNYSAIELNADQIHLNGSVLINGTVLEDKVADNAITEHYGVNVSGATVPASSGNLTDVASINVNFSGRKGFIYVSGIARQISTNIGRLSGFLYVSDGSGNSAGTTGNIPLLRYVTLSNPERNVACSRSFDFTGLTTGAILYLKVGPPSGAYGDTGDSQQIQYGHFAVAALKK